MMIDLRHQSEQRGHFEPLGRLLTLETAHGVIQFGTQQGEGIGPDLAHSVCADESCTIDDNALLVLGQWTGLPALRRNSQTPCPRCKHTCEICGGTGKKQCEGLDCGGRGWTNGNWLPCPGPDCYKDTGQFKPTCVTCATSEVRGMIREQVPCLMCKGTKVMICSGCKGTKKRSTGRINGSLDWRLPACKACAGTGWKGEWVAQDVKKFTNAQLDPLKWQDGKKWPAQTLLALGPIHDFTVKDFTTLRLRSFEVSPDSKGDYLMLLVPKVLRGRAKAYLVGGVVRERSAVSGAA